MPAFVFISAAAVVPVHAEELDRVLSMIDISGFIRIRYWDTVSRTMIPGKLPYKKTGDRRYQNGSYIDLFMRNRINLKIIPEVEVKTVFDISSRFGNDDSALGKGKTDVITRNVCAVFKPFEGSEITAGLQPFSTANGFVLAKDGAGLQFLQSLFKKKLTLNVSYIKAYNNAADSYGDGSEQAHYIWDDIVILGMKASPDTAYSMELYYLFEDDRYTDSNGLLGDRKKGPLHWVGMHHKIMAGNWLLRFGGIYNAGYMLIRDTNNNFRTINVRAGLLDFETGYSTKNIQVSIIAEGATGDPNNRYAGISFQDIKSSHGYSFIAVNNNGGIALRDSSGGSCWYGLYGCGLSLQYTILDSLIMKMKLLHFETTKVLYWRGHKSSWLGDEIDLGMDYDFKGVVSLFFMAGGFLPQRAYSAMDSMKKKWHGFGIPAEYDPLIKDWDHDGSRSMIFEFMAGIQASWD